MIQRVMSLLMARSDCNCLGASSIVCEGYQDPELQEAVAGQELLSLVNDLLVRRVRVTFDSLGMTNTLHDDYHEVCLDHT